MKQDMMQAKELSKKTGIYMTNCWQALKLCEFNMELAYEYLKLKQADSRYKTDSDGNKVPYESKDYLELAKAHLISE